MRARIFQPSRSTMQSGTARSGGWTLEFDPNAARVTEPLMGWTSSRDTQGQVRLSFDTCKAAEDYALAHGIDYVVTPPQGRKPNIRPRGYGENFSPDRKGPWTH